MAEVMQTTLSPTKLELLAGWIGRQRWYSTKGLEPRLRRLGGYRLDDPAGEVGIETIILVDEAPAEPIVYQVPLTYRSAPCVGAEAGLIGTMEHGVLGTRYVYDAPHDPVYREQLLALACGRAQAQHATTSYTPDPAVVGHPRSHARIVPASSRVLSGEQSNTSMVHAISGPDGRDSSAGADGSHGADGSERAERQVVVKLFRMLHPGANPDVVLQNALADAGFLQVPRPIGDVVGDWADPANSRSTDRCAGHLAFAQEFLPGAQDGWRIALDSIRAGTDFTRAAHELGIATARAHSDLTRVMPTATASKEQRAALAAGWRSRLRAALGEAPALQEQAAAIEAVFDRAAAASWPDLQRVHGDYHLGQVLRTPEHGWFLIDFEGEPLRPLAERNEPDLALRDVAGMLRSLDYAAHSRHEPDPAGSGQAGRDPAGSGAAEWARDTSRAFLDGYASICPDPRGDADRSALLEALLLDKALYEVSYEARSRPTWLNIPLAAVQRLCRSAGAPAGITSRSPAAVSTESTESTAATPSPAPSPRPSHERSASEMTASQPPTTPEQAAGAPERAATPAAAAYHSAPLPVDPHELDLLVRGGHGDPHSILGAHVHNGGVTIRALRPLAKTVQVELPDGSVHDMDHDYEGIWVRQLDDAEVSDYRLLVTYHDDITHRQDDPYRFLPTLGAVDLHLIGEGRHEELWKVLGSHVRKYKGTIGKVKGTSFAVWAPNARAIRVVGSFNRWDGQAHPMRALGSSGVWELFVPGVGVDTTYKYEILGADGYWRTKADPLARATECPPATASVVTKATYEWTDDDWMAERAQHLEPHNEPMSIYEVHLGSWRQGSSYVDLAEHLVNYVTDLGFTHVEFLPVAEHPYGPSWGYQVTGYYAPTSRFGSPDEFRYLVDRLHQAGVGVILDWVPGHFPKDAFALARFDGQPLYEHPDPRRGDQPDWGTHVFDFGRPQVRNFLVANASYWIEEFHIDGLRVDAVASMLYLDYSRKDGEWLPNQYGGREHLEAVQLLQEMNATVYRRYPGAVTIAEESTSWPGITRPTYMGGLGFGLKWNMGWMHDSLEYAKQPPIYRQYHHHQLTFSMVYAYSENFVLPISHDEVVYGKGSMLRKMPGDRWEQLAGMRVFYAYMWSHPGKQLLFMGQEFAQEAEWADARSLDWWLLDHEPHWRMHKLVKDLNHIYSSRPALWQLDNDPAGFSWIDANDASGNTFSYLRFGHPGEDGVRPVLASVVNFSGGEHHHYRIGLPRPGVWNEILNTDSPDYGGSGTGNLGQIVAEEVPWHGQPYSALVTLPRLGGVWFEPAAERAGEAAVDEVAAEATATEAAGAAEGPEQPVTGGLRAQTRGVARPELSGAPVHQDDGVASGIEAEHLAEPRVGTSGLHGAAPGKKAKADKKGRDPR